MIKAHSTRSGLKHCIRFPILLHFKQFRFISSKSWKYLSNKYDYEYFRKYRNTDRTLQSTPRKHSILHVSLRHSEWIASRLYIVHVLTVFYRASKSPDFAGDLPIFDKIMIISRSPDLE